MHLMNKPTNATLKEGIHKIKLISVNVPDVADDKTPYIAFTFILENGATTVKNLFEKSIEFLTNNAKKFYNIEDTNATLSDIIPLMQADFFPVSVTPNQYTTLQGKVVNATDWYFFATEEKTTTATNEKEVI